MRLSTACDGWVISSKSEHARLRLFCFPYAGGGASIFQPWSQSLPPEIQVCAVQLPGRENRMMERPYRHTGPLVEAMAPALAPYLDLPFAFFGHSLGALIAFELARRLGKHQGLWPIHLFVSGHRAPQLLDRLTPLHDLPEAEFIRKVRLMNGTHEEVFQNAELLKLVLPLLRADFEMAETYAYSAGEPLDCPISAYGGVEDGDASREELLDWRQQSLRTFALRMFPGNHFFLHSARTLVLQAITSELLRALPWAEQNQELGRVHA